MKAEQLKFGFGKEKGLEGKVKSEASCKKEFEPSVDFYIPIYKNELVTWLYNYCAKTGKKPKNFKEMKKDQLYAIYYSIRKREG